MAISQQQKVDYLLKKIGFSKAKTGAPDSSGMSGSQTEKQPFGEAIPSPLVVPNSSLWNEGDSIPATPPGSDTSQVKVYLKSSPLRMTADSSIANNRAFIAYTTYNNTSSARLTNWIDTQFGPDYQIEVYREDPSSGTQGVDYFKLAEGGGNTTTGSPDGWFFDYSAGILNFSDTNTPASISSSNIYVVGYRYIGQTGAPTSGISTFSYLDLAVERNLDIGAQGGISTFRNNIDANAIIEGIAGENKIPSLYANMGALPAAGSYHGMFAHVHATGRGYFAHAGNWLELVNKETNGVVGTGTENYQIGIITATNATFTGDVSIAGTLTYQDVTSIDSVGIITANQGVNVPGGEVKVGSNIQLGNAGVITALSFVGDGSGLIGVASTDYIITGTAATFNNTVDINGDLDVDGHTNLDNVSIAGVTTFSGIVDAINTPASIRVAQDIQHKGDADTKISFPSADTIRFDTAGTQRLNIASNGNISVTNDLDVDGHTNLDNVSIAGVTTITQDLDVDGHTNLDNVSIAGVTTFASHAYFADNDKLYFGTNNNLEIYHNPVNSYIANNSNNLFITNTDGEIFIQAKAGENSIICNDDGAVQLYHDDSLKCQTRDFGFSIFQDLDVDGHTNLDNVSVAGVITATSFFGDGSGLIGVASTDYIITGTAATFNNNVDFNGNVNFNSSLSFSGSSGLNGQYLRSTGSGVAWASFPTMRTTSTVTASAGQTTFSFTYNVGFLDVFVNGTKLTDSEFTATNGSSVVLAVGCFVGDIVDLISYNTVSGGGGSGGGVNIQDEGSQLSTTATTLNFVGDGIVASGSGATKTITVGAASTAELRANTLEVVGVSTFKNNVTLESGSRLYLYNANSQIYSSSSQLQVDAYARDIQLKTNAGGGDSKDIILHGGAVGELLRAHGTGDVDITNTLGIGGSITKASGNLDIRASNLNLKNAAGSSTYAVFNNGGSAELNWNNTKRLETSSAGVSVTGTLSATAFDGDGSALTGLPGATSDAQFNTKSGTNAGSSFNGVNPTHNSLFGYKAGEDITNGDYNTFIGSQAGANATDSNNAVAVGYQALFSMAGSRSYQTAVGYQALYSNAHGQECTAVGYQALYTNNTGDDQSAFGVFALKTSNGANNSAFGYKSLENVSNGANNSVLGSNAGSNLQTGSNNLILGYNAQSSTTSVSNEITLGNTNVNHLRIPGIGCSISEGGAVIAGIVTAGQFVGDGSQLTGIPGGSGVTVDTTGNTSAGTNAGSNITWPSAQRNTLYGFDAGKLISASDEQSAFGHSALESHNNSSNGGNSAFGYQALQTSTSIYNAAFGRNSLQNENGNGYNAAFGASAGENVSTGHDNTLIGYAAGDNLQTGTYNIVIGSNADTSSSSVNRECTIGSETSGRTIQSFRVPGIGLTVTNGSNTIPSNHSQLSLTGHANFVGVVTATKFIGDGSQLTNLPGGGGGGGTDVGITTALAGTFSGSPGSSSTINTYAYHDDDKVFEYTVYIKKDSNFQTSKLLVMRDVAEIYCNQYAVMSKSSLIVQLDATISSGNINLRATPESGVSGTISYRIKREVM